jgi:uncharacterized RDD family membrane protein YckC
MPTITVQTSQNIEIDYDLAGVGDRIVAYLIDVLIYIAYYTSLMLLQSTGDFSGYGFQFVAIIPILVYQLLTEVFLNGQSIGKRVKKIRVISLDGNQPHIGQYLIRWLFRIVDIMLSSGLVAILSISLSEKAQRVGDMLAGTTVVRTRRQIKIDDTLFLETDENYIAKYPQAVNLSDQDISLLKEVLNRQVKSNDESMNLTRKAADKVMKMLNIMTHDNPSSFLQDIIRDYNFLTSKEV